MVIKRVPGTVFCSYNTYNVNYKRAQLDQSLLSAKAKTKMRGVYGDVVERSQ